MRKINFMNLPREYSGKESKFLILPINYEGKVSFLRGASYGCDKIIKASSELEYYDVELKKQGFLNGIRTLKRIKIRGKLEKQEHAVEKISLEVQRVLEKSDYYSKGKFLVVLGGDHSITIGVADAFERFKKKFSVIIFDAHADLRYSWNNSTCNHACVARRTAAKHKTLILGIRSADDSEIEFSEKNKNIVMLRADEFSIEKLESTLENLEEDVYLSIDADVFDPSLIRFVGTPEPGGFSWNQVISALKIIFKNKNVIGADITEFSPKGSFYNYASEAYALAKLVYKMINLKA
ncbi:MAG: agmatinase [Candidatus Woesearchaeota archaeon]